MVSMHSACISVMNDSTHVLQLGHLPTWVVSRLALCKQILKIDGISQLDAAQLFLNLKVAARGHFATPETADTVSLVGWDHKLTVLASDVHGLKTPVT